jgi:hypothetical protein
MKTRDTIHSNVLVALMFLLAAAAAQAQTVIFDTMTPDPSKAVGIDGGDVPIRVI